MPCSSSNRARRFTCATVHGLASPPRFPAARAGASTGAPATGPDCSPPTACLKRSSDPSCAAMGGSAPAFVRVQPHGGVDRIGEQHRDGHRADPSGNR